MWKNCQIGAFAFHFDAKSFAIILLDNTPNTIHKKSEPHQQEQQAY